MTYWIENSLITLIFLPFPLFERIAKLGDHFDLRGFCMCIGSSTGSSMGITGSSTGSIGSSIGSVGSNIDSIGRIGIIGSIGSSTGRGTGGSGSGDIKGSMDSSNIGGRIGIFQFLRRCLAIGVQLCHLDGSSAAFIG